MAESAVEFPVCPNPNPANQDPTTHVPWQSQMDDAVWKAAPVHGAVGVLKKFWDLGPQPIDFPLGTTDYDNEFWPPTKRNNPFIDSNTDNY
eukprot:NODE_1701_length_503_cov_696.680617_g1623_i0.p2 GENE.NODE_1701_length_503_cov_696.680617_g1623_i0~~NODE_1701_length_503_cov_696.680617_g1623_i0.p2  ORF type:complete len:91 (-),score=26.36 NODE_1701_length_503_cov_696.680617_g1623_i0:159-431(-)